MGISLMKKRNIIVEKLVTNSPACVSGSTEKKLKKDLAAAH